MLESLGLDSDAETVYELMVADPSINVRRLATALEWPVERVRAALTELAKLSLLRPSWEHDGELRLVSPSVGLASLLARQEAALSSLEQQIAAGRQAVAAMAAKYSASHALYTHRDIEELAGLDAVRTRIEELSGASDDLAAFVPGGPQPVSSLAASRQLDQEFLGRGARMRTIYLDSIRNDPQTSAYARWLVGLGAEVRTTATLPLRMVLYDMRIGLTPLNPDANELGALAIQDRGIMLALDALFELVWAGAHPFGEERPRTSDGLTSQERETIAMLNRGYTDEMVARKLGVSIRTCRRLMADLMDRLDARSRFQAGVRAAQRGWVR